MRELRELEGRAETLAGSFNTQDVANTLWAVRVGDDEGAGGAGRVAGGHVQCAGRGKHAVGVCDDEAGARGGDDEDAGGAGGGAGGHVQCAGRGKHEIGRAHV